MPIVLIVVGILAEAFASLSIFEQWPMFGVLAFMSVAITVVGGGLVATGSRRLGAWLVIAGSVIFVPLGLIAIVGARKVLDADSDAAFEERRAQG